MINVQNLIDRYKKVIKSPYSAVTGFLSWGGKQYYAINSDEALNINSQWNKEFITNEEGFVEEYKIGEDQHPYLYFLDIDHTKPVSYEEWIKTMAKEGYPEDRYDLYTTDNPFRVERKYRYKTTDLYPWPWYPDREIKSFTVVRIAPFWTLGEEYEVEETGLITSEDDQTKLWLDEALSFPEFFKPNYK
jgi:hypothetical protein